MLFPAETDVGCPVLGNGEMGNLVTILVEYSHTVTGQIDVSRSSIVNPSEPISANTLRFDREPSV